jgi:hypothetical protein
VASLPDPKPALFTVERTAYPMKYIRQIHVEGSGTTPAYISRIRYSYTATGPLYEQKCSDAVRAIEARISDYHLLDDRTGIEVPVAVRTSRRGIKCIATTANDFENDALMSLETF